jgi:hypothetical protein
MNIIFKTDSIATQVDEKYTILDLDTFKFPDGSLHTACCIVENIPILELVHTEHLKDLHDNLIKNYGLKDWNFCEQALEHLLGKFGGEMDSFYNELKTRIELLKTQDLNDTWSPIIDKK